MKLARLATVAFLPVIALSVIPTDPAESVTARDWKAGNIISDSLFTDADAMSVSQIQSWLDARLANCDEDGSERSELGGGTDYNRDGKITRAEFGRTYGNPAPFTCLNKFYEVPKTSPSPGTPKNNYGNTARPTGSRSAAWIIHDAARRHNISPKVLLVKLGTESAGPLTSDTWPFERQYLYAMGAHCPDSGPGGSANCDDDYAGFSLQMYEAAKLLRGYLTNMDASWWPYKTPRENHQVLYHVVERGCGSGNVYIENKATAALYTYTPYQPNAAALNNMYGTGDNCSTYGNRNFWRVYNDWFGSTTKITFDAMSTPRYMELTKDLTKIDMRTGKADGVLLQDGMEIYFTSKFEFDGELYLRTEYDTRKNIPRAIKYSDLQDVKLDYVSMDVPRWMKVQQSGAKVDPSTKQPLGSSIATGEEFYFTDKVEIAGDLYLRTEYNSRYAHDRVIPFERLSNISTDYTRLSHPRWMVTKKDTALKHPTTEQSSDTVVRAGENLFYDTKITVNGQTLLRSRSNTSQDKDLVISYDDLADEIPYDPLNKTRYFTLKSDRAKTNIRTNQPDGVTLNSGMKILFDTKYTHKGELYLRTSYDSSRHIERAIPYSELEEVR